MASPTGGVWAMKSGDFQPTNFASTQSGIQAALDYCSTGGEVYIGPGTITSITNLTMYADTTLRGAGMNMTILKRSAAATGTCLRERTAAEGNSAGGRGIWVRDLRIDGNGSAGDGIDFGNQVAANQFNFNAGLSHVHVRGFSSGVGMTLRCNAINLYYIWSNVNATGIKTQGGFSQYHGLYAEGNTTLNFDIASSDDQFFGLHSEVGGNVHVQITGNNNCFFGSGVQLDANATHIITVKTGYSRNSFINTTLNTNSFTFSNLIYYEAWTYGTGASNTFVQSFVDNGAFTSYTFDSVNNKRSTTTGANLTGNNIQAAGTLGATGAATMSSTLGVTGATALTGNLTGGVAGTSFSATLGQGATGAEYSTLRVRSGNSGGAEAVAYLNQNGTDVSRWMYNGTATFLDAVNGLRFRDSIGGTERARIDSTGLSVTGALAVSGGTTPTGRLILPMGEISYFSTTGTAVVIATQSDGSTNMVKAAPATALSTGVYAFDNGGADNGRLRYTGATTRMFHVACSVSFSSAGAADVAVLGIAKGGTVIAASKCIRLLGAGGDKGSTALHVMVGLATNEYVEFFMGNVTDADDFTVNSLNIFALGI